MSIEYTSSQTQRGVADLANGQVDFAASPTALKVADPQARTSARCPQ